MEALKLSEDYMSAVASQRPKAVGQRAEATVQGTDCLDPPGKFDVPNDKAPLVDLQ